MAATGAFLTNTGFIPNRDRDHCSAPPAGDNQSPWQSYRPHPDGQCRIVPASPAQLQGLLASILFRTSSRVSPAFGLATAMPPGKAKMLMVSEITSSLSRMTDLLKWCDVSLQHPMGEAAAFFLATVSVCRFDTENFLLGNIDGEKRDCAGGHWRLRRLRH